MGWGPSKRLHVAPFSNGSCTCHPQCEVSMLCVHREVMWSLSQSLCQKNIDLSLKSEVEGLPRCHEAMATPAVLTNRMPYRATAQRQSEGCAKCTKTTSRLFAQSCKRAIYIYMSLTMWTLCATSQQYSVIIYVILTIPTCLQKNQHATDPPKDQQPWTSDQPRKSVSHARAHKYGSTVVKYGRQHWTLTSLEHC